MSKSNQPVNQVKLATNVLIVLVIVAVGFVVYLGFSYSWVPWAFGSLAAAGVACWAINVVGKDREWFG